MLPGRQNFTHNGRINLAMKLNSIQGVDNANNLTECPIERVDPGTAGCDQGPIDIEQQQLHAAILGQGEFYFRLQKDFRGVKIYSQLQSAGLFFANKAECEGREQHLISTSTRRASHMCLQFCRKCLHLKFHSGRQVGVK